MKLKTVIDTIQGTVGVICFMLILGFAGKCEHGGSIADFVINSTIAFAVIGVDLFILNLREKVSQNERR